MSDKLDLSLPQKKTKIAPVTLVILVLVSALFVVSVANLVLGFVAPKSGASGISAGLGPAGIKELALKLQKSNLSESAAKAWDAYIAAANPGNEEKANILYTAGAIWQEAGFYEEALNHYYQSEVVYKDKKIEQELSRRVEECLEALGKFAALRYELSDRVSINKNAKADEVVAQIGPEKITRADLDMKIDQYIGYTLSQNAPYMSKEDQNKMKEELFKNYSGDDGKAKMLNQFIVQEILYRKAREEKIADDPDTRALVKDVERQLLAQKLLSKMVGEKINLTESDLANYYAANKAKYIKDGVQKPYDQVKQDVYADLRGQKESELQGALIEELKNQYAVVLFPSKLKVTAQGSQATK
jgi:hypothetical protein